MQATASTKDLDGADIARRRSHETRYQLHRESNSYPVRELDPQCALPGEERDGASAGLSFGGPPPGAARPRKIRTQLLLYPVWYCHKASLDR